MPNPTGDIVGMGFQLANMAYQDQQKTRDYRRQKELMGLQNEIAMKNYRETSYPFQVGMIKQAGLNPGLIYGMGGGATGTTGNTSAPSPAGAGNYFALDIAQIALLEAQRRNIEADTKNKEAGAQYTSGAQTRKTEAEAEYTEGPLTTKTATEQTNIAADTNRINTLNEINDIDLKVKKASIDETISIIKNTAAKLEGDARSAKAQGEIDEQTMNERIKQIKLDTITKGVEIALMRRDITLKKEQAHAIAESVIQRNYENYTQRMNALTGQTNADTNQRRLAQDKFVNDVSNETKLNYEWASDIIHGVGIPMILQGIKPDPLKPVPVSGFGRGNK